MSEVEGAKLLEGMKTTHAIICNGIEFFDYSKVDGFDIAAAHEFRQWLEFQKEEAEKTILELGGSLEEDDE